MFFPNRLQGEALSTLCVFVLIERTESPAILAKRFHVAMCANLKIRYDQNQLASYWVPQFGGVKHCKSALLLTWLTVLTESFG